MSAPEKVSFTVRRPTPVSRAPSSGAESDSSSYKIPSLPRRLIDTNSPALGSPLARSTTSSPKPNGRSSFYSNDLDSSEEDEEIRDELVTGFDKFGVQRRDESRLVKAMPLVIPALKNRDWRELARKRKSAAQFVPHSAKAGTGTDGSVGGLGTKDTVNTGPVISGLQLKASVKKEEEEHLNINIANDIKMEPDTEEDEDKQALRAILAGTNGADTDGPIVDIIPTPVSEADAYKQDVQELPESATLDDYARIPVSQFGAALLRGMGWKEGTPATRQPGKGLVQPYLPEARPALLGIGAKERDVIDDGSAKLGGKIKRPERRYVPVVKREKEVRATSAAGSLERMRERSRSPRPRNSTPTSRRSPRPRERDSELDSRRRREISDNHDQRRDPLRDRDHKSDSDRERSKARSREGHRRKRD